MRVAVISVNFGNFDKEVVHVKQSISCDYFHYTDKNFTRRFNAMTPRLQARLVKLFSWQIVPDYNYYIWVDSSCFLPNKNSVKWFIDNCNGVDMAFFKHPDRNSVQEEADYLEKRLKMKCSYITSRYENEYVKEQMKEIINDKNFIDNSLFATTAFIYKNCSKVHDMMKDWWYHTSRYHICEQLSLPYVIFKNNIKIKVIPDNYLKTKYLEYTRNQNKKI